MDDGRSPGVEEVKALEDLTTPASQDLNLHHLKPFQVPAHITWTRYGSDGQIGLVLKSIFTSLTWT